VRGRRLQKGGAALQFDVVGQQKGKGPGTRGKECRSEDELKEKSSCCLELVSVGGVGGSCGWEGGEPRRLGEAASTGARSIR